MNNSTEPLRPAKPAGQRLDLPFRDGAHIYHEMDQLGLPGYAIYGDIVENLEQRPHPGYNWLTGPRWDKLTKEPRP